MSAPTRKRPTSTEMIDCFTAQGSLFRIPSHIANKYLVASEKSKSTQLKFSLDNESIAVSDFFKEMDKKYTEAGALLRGTRYREGLSQKEFAKRIEVTQSDLSKMETGKRSIGKVVAKRIAKEFSVDYRYFLG